MPPCHPSVPLIGNIPPMWSTFVLGGHLWQWLTVTRAKTIETINRNPDILGSKVNKLDRDIPGCNLFHCTFFCQFKIIRFVSNFSLNESIAHQLRLRHCNENKYLKLITNKFILELVLLLARRSNGVWWTTCDTPWTEVWWRSQGNGRGFYWFQSGRLRTLRPGIAANAFTPNVTYRWQCWPSSSGWSGPVYLGITRTQICGIKTNVKY